MIYSKKAQVSIFVIVAIVIVAGVLIFLGVSNNVFDSTPKEFQEVYTYYSSCIEDSTRAAIDLAGTQGGHIYLDDYQAGSDYAPFSNQFNFLGFPVPYWSYVSGNGLVKENVISEQEIEEEISRYVSERLQDCDFDSFYQKGFEINFSEAETRINILNNRIDVSLKQKVSVSDLENSAIKDSFDVSLESSFGELYSEAKDLYNYQKEEAFLEERAIDVLRLYAPVDGVEIQCNQKIWKTREVKENLLTGLEDNINTLKFKGNYYSVSKEREYFILDKRVSNEVNLVFDRRWPSRVEITGAEDELMVAEPVGNQEGLGILGFCYSPYHFVYDLNFPVLFQLRKGEEFFQFPVVVVIDNNLAREGAYLPEIEELYNDSEGFDVCSLSSKNVEFRVYDSELNPLDAQINYYCLNQKCSLGKSELGVLEAEIPTCSNGYVEARKEGYEEKKIVFSSNLDNSGEIFLDKLYETEVKVLLDGKEVRENVFVSFLGNKAKSAVLPENKFVKLSEGMYNISVFVYSNSSLTIPGSKKTQCVEVSSGLLGAFGATNEECFDIEIPPTKIDYALVGGGRTEAYILEEDLNKGRIVLEVSGLPKVEKIEQLQYNFAAFDEQNVEVKYE